MHSKDIRMASNDDEPQNDDPKVSKKKFQKKTQTSVNTSYLTDSYIIFTLKMESVPKSTILA